MDRRSGGCAGGGRRAGRARDEVKLERFMQQRVELQLLLLPATALPCLASALLFAFPLPFGFPLVCGRLSLSLLVRQRARLLAQRLPLPSLSPAPDADVDAAHGPRPAPKRASTRARFIGRGPTCPDAGRRGQEATRGGAGISGVSQQATYPHVPQHRRRGRAWAENSMPWGLILGFFFCIFWHFSSTQMVVKWCCC